MTKEQAIKKYNSIIEFRKSNPPRKGVYTETHHIVPRSCGGKDDADNLVLLTAQEHYRVHELLPFIYASGKKHAFMVQCWRLMSGLSGAVHFDANKYAVLRKEYSRITSNMNKQRWKDKKFASKMSDARREQWKNPEFASKMSKVSKKRIEKQWKDPDFVSKISRARTKQMEKQWKDPDYASKMRKCLKKNGEKYKKSIVAIFEDGQEKSFSSLTEAANKLECNLGHICECLRGYRKTTHGIRFRYADDTANATTEKTTQLAS